MSNTPPPDCPKTHLTHEKKLEAKSYPSKKLSHSLLRENNYDLLRIFASIAVIFIHANGFFYEQAYLSEKNITWQIETLINIITRFSVPCFVMLSGAFILNKDIVSIKDFYINSIKKIFFPATMIILIISGFKLIENVILNDNLMNQVISIISGSSYGLWYMHMLFGLYFLAPFVYCIKVQLTSKEYLFFAIMMLIWAALSQLINKPKMAGSMAVVFPFLSYFIMGNVIYSEISKLKNKRVTILSCIVAIFCVGITWLFRNKVVIDQYITNAYTCFFSPTIILFSICVFIFFGTITINVNLQFFANKSFYAYLVHYPILVIVKHYIEQYKYNDIVKIFVLSIMTTVISYIISYFFELIIMYLFPNTSTKK